MRCAASVRSSLARGARPPLEFAGLGMYIDALATSTRRAATVYAHVRLDGNVIDVRVRCPDALIKCRAVNPGQTLAVW